MNDKEMTVEMIAESIVDEIRGEYTKRRPPFDEAVALLAETLTKYEQRGYRLGQEDMQEDMQGKSAVLAVDYLKWVDNWVNTRIKSRRKQLAKK